MLRALVGAGHDVAAVLTAPDARRGRRKSPTPTPVKAAALDLGLHVAGGIGELPACHADLGVVVAYGYLIPAEVLERLPMVNLHFSLLPRWRGAAPVERAIMAGDEETGVCLMAVVPELDAGPLYGCRRVAIASRERTAALRERLTRLGTELLLEHLAAGEPAQPRPQEGEPTYAAKLRQEDLRLDWRRPAVELDRLVRAGRAWTMVRGRRLLVMEAVASERPAAGGEGRGGRPGSLRGTAVVCGSGELALVRVAPEGRAPMAAADWIRGARLGPGAVLGR